MSKKPKSKTRDITLTENDGLFIPYFKKKKKEKKDYDFESLAALRQLLSNEKARLLNVIKNHNPGSIYELAKKLGRDFKSVRDDVKLLERFGFIDLVAEKTGNRQKLRPVVTIDSLNITLHV